jgi:hypothetical protein
MAMVPCSTRIFVITGQFIKREQAARIRIAAICRTRIIILALEFAGRDTFSAVTGLGKSTGIAVIARFVVIKEQASGIRIT